MGGEIIFSEGSRVRRNKLESEHLESKTWSLASLAGKGLSQV